MLRAVLVAALLALPVSAASVTLTFTFSGSLQTVDPSVGSLLRSGDPFSGSLVAEVPVPLDSFGIPLSLSVPLAFDANIGNFSLSNSGPLGELVFADDIVPVLSASASASTLDPVSPSLEMLPRLGPVDLLAFSSPIDPASLSLPAGSSPEFLFVLADTKGISLFSPDDLTSFPLHQRFWEQIRVRLVLGEGASTTELAVGRVESFAVSAVPEPALALLLCAAALAVRRRSRTR